MDLRSDLIRRGLVASERLALIGAAAGEGAVVFDVEVREGQHYDLHIEAATHRVKTLPGLSLHTLEAISSVLETVVEARIRPEHLTGSR